MIKAVLLSFSFVSVHIILVMSFRKMKVEICVIVAMAFLKRYGHDRMHEGHFIV